MVQRSYPWMEASLTNNTHRPLLADPPPLQQARPKIEVVHLSPGSLSSCRGLVTHKAVVAAMRLGLIFRAGSAESSLPEAGRAFDL